MRILYLGTPDFAVIPLEALVDAGYTIITVLTQPDRPAGRRRTLTAPPVKLAAERLGIPVLQPVTLRDADVGSQLAALQPDIGIVAAYGEILRKAVLNLPPLGYLNIHPSLLPRHRGPAPVATAILEGDTETGVTIMKLNRRMDSGPIVEQTTVPLLPDARTGPMTDRLFTLGAQMLIDVLPRYATGTCALREQDDSQATMTRLIAKTDGVIDWSQSAHALERATRAYTPWPGATTTWQGQPLKLLRTAVQPDWHGDAAPGTIITTTPVPTVATGSGALQLHELQPAGKRPMSGSAWITGQRRQIVGQCFGEQSHEQDMIQ